MGSCKVKSVSKIHLRLISPEITFKNIHLKAYDTTSSSASRAENTSIVVLSERSMSLWREYSWTVSNRLRLLVVSLVLS